MESELIPSDKITSSSVLSNDDAPEFARLNGLWAWSPKYIYDDDDLVHEWIQVSRNYVFVPSIIFQI